MLNTNVFFTCLPNSSTIWHLIFLFAFSSFKSTHILIDSALHELKNSMKIFEKKCYPAKSGAGISLKSPNLRTFTQRTGDVIPQNRPPLRNRLYPTHFISPYRKSQFQSELFNGNWFWLCSKRFYHTHNINL